MSDSFSPRTIPTADRNNQVDVWPLGGFTAGQVPHTTALFRQHTFIPELCDAAIAEYEAAPDDAPFSVLSVGSSYGAELDSVLAYCDEHAPALGSLTLRGVDVYRPVVEYANAGKYSAVAPPNVSPETAKLVNKFDLFPDLPGSNGLPLSEFHIRTTGLRKRHDVEFVQADLIRERPDLPPANLVLCNNVMTHLVKDGRALPLLRGLVRYMQPGALLSIGSSNHTGRQAVVEEACRLGLQPILSTMRKSQKVDFAFQKPKE